MPQVRPMLDDIELEHVQQIDVDGDQVLLDHGVPGLEGDFLQRLERRASVIRLSGVLAGATAQDDLKTLRDRFRSGDPLPFVADIATATRVGEVLIQDLAVRELAGKPARFEYAFLLREYQAPPPPPTPVTPEIPPPPSNRIVEGVGTLIVEVVVEGQPGFDFDRVRVTVRGQQEDGTDLSRTLTNRTADNVWEEEEFPVGSYTVEAVAPEDGMSGSEPANVRAGETERVTIVLRAGATVAHAFIVHFTFDRAFVEPCLMRVLRRASNYAASHVEEKLVIVGHTDEVGSHDYNRSLGDRRARTVYAALTYGADPDAAVNEWDEIRRPRPAGESPSIHEGRGGWDIVEYQYILQDLGFYRGNVDGRTGPLTDEAIRAFQQAHAADGLVVNGVVGPATWRVLIDAYLGNYNLNLPPTRFLPNCEGEILRWLSCGEHMPLPDTPRPCSEPAWRPNRRSELLFVNASSLPCEVPRPVTFDLPPPDGVGGGWCVGPGDANTPCCFVTRDPNERGKWLIQPADAGTLSVRGTIRLEDGTPAANVEYVLIAPDGEYLHKNASGGADDGEIICGSNKGSPNPVNNRTNSNGEFDHPRQTPVGIYTLEIKGPYVARPAGRPREEGRGNVVCRYVAAGDTFDVTVVDAAAAAVSPSITAPDVVVVRKPHTNPARRPVILRVDRSFTGTGTFDRSSDRIDFHTAATGGAEIDFNGVDNVFTPAQLLAGHTVFADGARHSDALNDVELTLTLRITSASGGPPTVTIARASMTAVELTLDIHSSRPAPGVAPAPLPQPPAAPPPAGTATDKWNRGRFVQVANPSTHHERTLLLVREVQPSAFSGALVLRQVTVAGNDVTGPSNRMQAFENEAGPPPPAIGNPLEFGSGEVPATGRPFWVEGRNVSAAPRDVGFQLGLRGVEDDGDRVAVTVIQLQMITAATAAAPAATFTRIGLWDNAFRAAGTVFNEQAEADNFVGADTRRFHIRVQDASQRGAGHINAEWHAVDENGNDFHVPADRTITLVEDAANQGVFMSRALMMVTDAIDHNQGTHSGLAAGLPDAGVVRNRNQSNHRLRRVTMEGDLIARYRHPLSGATVVNERLPVFERAPREFRRRVPLQVFVLRVAAGGAGVVSTAAGAAIWTTDLRVIRETYERIGLKAETVVAPAAPAADTVTEGGESVVLIDPPAGVNPFNVSFANESAIGTAHPALADTIRVFFVGGLASGNGGETWDDGTVPAGDPRRGTVFTIQATGPYAAAHEVGHALTNKQPSTGHYSAPAAPAGNRLHNDQNLMKRQFLGAERVNGPKRLWDDNDADAFNQFTAIRGSHYTRNF